MHDITIDEKILGRNDALAQENRKALKERGIYTINMVSSPGSGKTTLIERTVERLRERFGLAVIEGDLQTDLDAQRLLRYNIPVKQITTGKACHLDAHMIHHTLPWLFEQGAVRLLILENVGNMVCPAEYDLGEDMKVAVMSVTEGDDKPLKYPALFHAARVLIINKIDLAPYTNFDLRRAEENALSINHHLKIFKTSCTDGAGIREWSDFLAEKAAG
ncbi:MAG: hydrogenase nickel incorporation protein HypB [Nitrospirota bacterium]